MNPPPQNRAFSLVEVTLALGILSVALVLMFGLLPSALSTNKQSADETRATGVLTAVVSDLNATPVSEIKSSTYGLSYAGDSVSYANEFGEPTSRSNARYRISTHLTPSSSTSDGHLLISWPAAQSDPSLADGKLELYLIIDRR